MLEKSRDAFRTISEVAEEMDLPQHVLRFWETRFSQIKPMKRGGGRRYYRSDDVDLLMGIRHLLYDEGYTIKGVQRILKEQGIKYVQTIWQDADPVEIELEAPVIAEPAPEPQPRIVVEAEPARVQPNGQGSGAPQVMREASEKTAEADPVDEIHSEPEPDVPAAPKTADQPEAVVAEQIAPEQVVAEPAQSKPKPSAVSAPRPTAAGRAKEPVLSRVSRTPVAPVSDRSGDSSSQELSRDDVRRLQSTLFELLECKRILDQVR